MFAHNLFYSLEDTNVYKSSNQYVTMTYCRKCTFEW